jgi:hypothetical protein
LEKMNPLDHSTTKTNGIKRISMATSRPSLVRVC